MRQQGYALFDENGNKITDISQIPFGQALSSQFELLIKKVDELVDALLGRLKPAIERALAKPSS